MLTSSLDFNLTSSSLIVASERNLWSVSSLLLWSNSWTRPSTLASCGGQRSRLYSGPALSYYPNPPQYFPRCQRKNRSPYNYRKAELLIIYEEQGQYQLNLVGHRQNLRNRGLYVDCGGGKGRLQSTNCMWPLNQPWQKFVLVHTQISTMGPAEREITPISFKKEIW